MSLVQSAKDALGTLFIMGFSGLELAPETEAFLSQARIGGVILFSPNYESPGQVAELINQVQQCRGELPLWVGVDQEGARVQRFKKGFTRIPEAALIGAMDSPKLTFEISEVIAKELKAVGVNLNFFPVADIHTNPRNPVIGPRSFGTTEEIVTKMVTAAIRGHLVQGVQPCVKHFPGHGDTHTDSHFALPKVDTTLEMMRERELKPFIKAFKSRCSMVMSAHIICTQIDPKVPGTLSKKVLQDLLRKELRYSKVVISDDMEMKAIADHFGIEDAPRMALEAGCDILCYRSEGMARQAYASLTRALDEGKLAPEIVIAAQARINDLKKEVLLPYEPTIIADMSSKIGTPEHQAIIDKVIDPSKNPETVTASEAKGAPRPKPPRT